jgi:hypothetical protein
MTSRVCQVSGVCSPSLPLSGPLGVCLPKMPVPSGGCSSRHAVQKVLSKWWYRLANEHFSREMPTVRNDEAVRRIAQGLGKAPAKLFARTAVTGGHG